MPVNTNLTNVVGDYLPLGGGTMTGNITMTGAGTVDSVDVSAIPTTYLPLAGGTMTGAIVIGAATNLANYGNSNSYEFLRDLLGAGRLIVPVLGAGWAGVFDGTGSLVNNYSKVSARTGATADSTSLNYYSPGFLGAGLALFTRINWDKKLTILADLVVNAPTANTFDYFGIYEKDSPAVGDAVDLTAKGIFLKIANLVLSGQAFDTELGSVDLATSCVADTLFHIKIVHTPGVNVEFFINGVSKGTTTREPSGQGAAWCRFAVIVDNGATAANHQLDMSNCVVYQEL